MILAGASGDTKSRETFERKNSVYPSPQYRCLELFAQSYIHNCIQVNRLAEKEIVLKDTVGLLTHLITEILEVLLLFFVAIF
jgi:hypothetical protein